MPLKQLIFHHQNSEMSPSFPLLHVVYSSEIATQKCLQNLSPQPNESVCLLTNPTAQTLMSSFSVHGDRKAKYAPETDSAAATATRRPGWRPTTSAPATNPGRATTATARRTRRRACSPRTRERRRSASGGGCASAGSAVARRGTREDTASTIK